MLLSESQLFMSVQSDLYDKMSDRFGYKEQVTTCDPYDCELPLCLTEHSSGWSTQSQSHLCPADAEPHCSWAERRGGLLLDASSAALLPNPLPVGAAPGAAEPLHLGSAEDSLCLPAVTGSCPAPAPVPEILPAVCMALGKCVSLGTQIRTVSFIDKVIV